MGLHTVLPPELWRLLFFHLYLPDIVSVSAACSAFQALASESLAEHRALRHRFHHIGHEHDHGQLREHAYWYLHLLTLLREPATAYYVEILTAMYTNCRLPTQPWTVFPVLSADEALIRGAVEAELLAGDYDAMVTPIILRMPNLKRLTLPTSTWSGLDIKYLMPIVARIAETASNADPDGGRMSPLSKLEHYEGKGTYAVGFEAIASLMALPSLRTMRIPIDIQNGDIREVVMDLAQHIRGPCAIRQVPTQFNETPEGVDWNDPI
ncbi:hypothetical protein K438DRAFT_2023445 [Mycena galopus ATCC 62051]|nr:hypothetical protein K438DRAFT_2023445 [Mycena galopus ATCC 62051]